MKLNNIKETFDKREIKASVGSWDKLAGRLDQEEKKNKKPMIYWLGAIAAILIIALLIYPVFNSQNVMESNEGNQIVIIDNPSPAVDKDDENIHIPSKIEENSIQTPIVINKESLNVIEEKSINKSIKKTLVQEQLIAQVYQGNTNSSPIKESKFESQQENTNVVIINNGPVYAQKEETVIAITGQQPDIEKKLTAQEEMELLLHKAIGSVEITTVATKTINPDKLLREAEWDMEIDKRNRLQKRLKKGFSFLKKEAITIVVKK